MTGGRAFPDEPRLRTASERALWSALRSQLLPDEILLSSMRFTDPRNGDVEADFVILMPSLGAAVVEVKGGQITFADGEWTTSNGRSTRRIHPVEQARSAKHALRRYLDRQPEWGRPLLRTEWLLAVPAMTVDGDLGPEARRDLLIDRDDLPHAMERIRAAVASPVNREPTPQGDWAETALSLLLRTVDGPRSTPLTSRSPVRTWLALALLVLVNVAIAGIVAWRLGPVALMVVGAVCLAASGLAWWYYTHRATAARGLLIGMAASLVGLAIGGIALALPASSGSESGTCSPNYAPCIPEVADLDCSAIRQQVTVTGTDVYGLDRDGDGIACELFPPAP